ncbi:MAG: dihydrofolate synthase/folylpolyglutamate synthase [Verrucomicrobiales bacterium]|jgi:dihydrofolate synthase/folylpolyglutamate synthase
MGFSEALRYLDAHINLEARAGYFEDLSLNSMLSLMELSGDPHHTFRGIHVTGTNGKGSTATMIACLREAQGLRVGRYSSPHLSSITERIDIDGEPTPEQMTTAADILTQWRAYRVTLPEGFILCPLDHGWTS